MAFVQDKKGGPYTKDERVKRQNEVQRLHFEYGYSASKISEMMKINRNTINDDIKHLYSNIREEIRQDSEELILRQIGRLESQRTRIVKSIIEEEYNIKNEKLLLDVDAKINELLVKTKGGHKEPKTEEQDSYRDFVLYLLVKYSKDREISREQIISEIINTEQCSVDDAEKIFSEMEDLGLSCCINSVDDYDLMEFAFLRRYLMPNDPFVVKMQSLFRMNFIYYAEIRNLEKKYLQEYGIQEKWSDEVFSKFNKDEKKHKRKHAETLSKIAVESLESLSDRKLPEKYIRYINVFFAEEKSQFLKIMDL